VWKIPIGGGEVLIGYNPLPVINPFATGVAEPLYLLLDSFEDVHHTDDGPQYNYWRKEKARQRPIARNAKQQMYRAARSTRGLPVPEELAAKYEPTLGSDLESVRLHRDEAAASAADGLNVRAYTVGRDIYFGAGEYAPHTPEGELLLAHELAHTQHSPGPRARDTATTERHADLMARQLVAAGVTRPAFAANDNEREARRRGLSARVDHDFAVPRLAQR